MLRRNPVFTADSSIAAISADRFGAQKFLTVVLLGSACLLVGPTQPIAAAQLSIDRVSVYVQASSAGDTAGYHLIVSPQKNRAPLAVPLSSSNGMRLATIDHLNFHVGLNNTPGIALDFGVTAASQDTVFKISSEVLAFETLPHPGAVAYAAASALDNNGDGATLTGLFNGDKAFQTRYNGIPWTSQISPVTAPAGGGHFLQETRPESGVEIISANVNSMQSEWHFRLSAYDTAGGSTAYTLLPEPSSLLLLGCVFALIAAPRRRPATDHGPTSALHA